MRKRLIDETKKTVRYIQKELELGRSVEDLAKEFNVARSTLYAYMSAHKITYVLKYPKGITEDKAKEILQYIKENPHTPNHVIQDKFLISYYQLKQILDVNGLCKQNLRVSEVKWTPAQERILRVYLKDTSKKYSDIARALGVTRMSVGRVVRKYNEVGGKHGYIR